MGKKNRKKKQKQRPAPAPAKAPAPATPESGGDPEPATGVGAGTTPDEVPTDERAGPLPSPKAIRLVVLGTVATAVAVAIWLIPFGSSNQSDDTSRDGPVFADFVGSERCAECHAKEYEVWKQSTHGQAGGPPDAVKLIARFDGVPLEFKDAVVTPFINPAGEHVFKVELQGEPPSEVKADLVVGGGHMYGGGTQSFFGRFPDGTVRFLPFDFIRDEDIWFVQLKEGGVWVPVSTEVSLRNDLANWPPHRALGSHGQLSNCQNCHGSQISVVRDANEQGYLTRFTTLRINCESCHGAGRRHIEIVSKAGYEKLEDIGMESLATLTKDQSLAVCFQCHAGKSILRQGGYFPGPGVPLDDHLSMKLPMFDGSRFMVDGRIRLFGYQANHLYSDCYLNGSMTCVDCHDPHSQGYRDVFWKPLEGKFDDGQCTGCHASKAIEPEKHSHHLPDSEGSRCTSCHMPFLQHQGLGSHLRFARSDHTIPIPRPAFDAGIGIESACLQCHKDLGTAALEAKVKEWYGELKPHNAVVAGLVKAKETTDPKVARDLLLHPKADHPMAQMDGLFTFLRRHWRPGQQKLDKELVDKLMAFTTSDDLDLKAVALMALQAGYADDAEVQRFLATQIETLGERKVSVMARWAITADQLAGVFMDKKDPKTAVKFMESAVRADPDDVTIRSHLALTHMMAGNTDSAVAEMESAIRLQPDNANLHVQLGMILVKTRRYPEAIKALEEALRHAPDDEEARQLLQQLQAAQRNR